ncbi:MAG: cupin domain-containing protein [Burkholderiaceae bacterium]
MCSSDSSGEAIGTVLIDNDTVRVTEWRFPKRGDRTGWHRHEYDYVVVPLFDGVLEIDVGNGEQVRAELRNGVPYYRDLGVEHDVINGNDFECAFIEVEVIK